MSKNKIHNVISVLSSIAIVASNIAGLAAQASQKEAKHMSISHTHEATGNTSYFHSHDEDEDCDCELDGTGNGTTIALLDAGVTGFDTYKQVSFVNDETIGSDHGDKMMSILHSKVPDARILDVRVLDDEGKGKYSDVCKGIKWAVDNDADIIVMSFAGESNSSLLWDAVEYAEKNNVFVVASAGNTYGEKEMYPAAFNNVISVGAIDEEGLIRDFSNFGKNVDTYSENSDGTSGAAQFIAAEAAITLQNFSDVDAAELREEFQLNEKAVVTRASEENADELVYAAARCSHTYRWVTTRQPSCTAAGSKSYKCSKCGYVLNTSSIAKLGHNLEGWRTTITATCKSQGKKIRACRRYGCNYQEFQTIPKTSHTYSWVTTRQPSCTVAGSKSYKCSKCGAVSTTSSIAKLGHNLEGWRTTKTATCSATGKMIRACKRYGCNYQESQDIPKIAHTYSWVTTKQPTCTAAGSKSYKCSKCGYVSTTSSVAKLGHDYEDWRVTKDSTCTATGTKARVCKRYGCHNQETLTIDKKPHTYSWVTTKQPTCTAAGSKSYKCSKCGYSSKTESIDKLGHDYEEWRVTKAPTATTEGIETRTCKRYGCHNQETRKIQPTSYKEFGSKEYFEDLEKRTEDQAESSIIIVDYYTRKAENMMKDFEAYEKYMNMNDIPEDRWNAFCNEFSECVIGSGYVTEEMHYFRNKLNRAPATLNELLAEKEKWELLSVLGSLYHMYNTAASPEGEYNLKFISKDGHHEAVYNKDGILLTQYNDPDNMGTFNYVGPNESVLDHKTYDVNTYDNWGNVKGGKIASAADLADAFARYEANQRAQRHRGEIEAILENRESYKGAYKVTGNFSFHVAFSLSDSEENDHIVSGGNVGDSYLISQGTVLVLDYAGVCTQGVDSVTGKSYVNFDFLPYIGTNLVKMY